jgi:hypothetical protein
MRRTELRPPRIYRVKTSVYQEARPGLLLDTRLWDLQVERGQRLFTPAPEGATWGGKQNWHTGARRGLLVIHANPAAYFDLTEDDVVAQLTSLCSRAGELGFPEQAARMLSALEEEVEEPLVLSVLRQQGIVEPWDRPAVQYRCPGSDDVACGTVVSPGASSRLRNHSTPAGEHCPRSNTSLTHDEREAGRITPAA